MKRAFTLLELAIVVAIVLVLAAILFPVFRRARENDHPSCMSPLKQIGLGVMQYTQDYDEILPAARTANSTGWAELLLPYVKSPNLFQCYAGQGSTTPFSTDYFYNGRLSSVTMSNVKQTSLTILAGDGDDNAPPWSSWAQMPPDAVTNTNSPSQRHLGGANYLYADGHVQWHKPGMISSTFASPTSRPTFAIR